MKTVSEMVSRLPNSDLASFLRETQRLVDAQLDRYLPPESVPPKQVHAAIRWSVFAGGKRFRPSLLFAVGETFGVFTTATSLLRLCAGNDSHLFVDSRRPAFNG